MLQLSISMIILLVFNVVSFVFFGVDKLKSKIRSWRISESRLLLVAIFGPFGAFVGMLFI